MPRRGNGGGGGGGGAVIMRGPYALAMRTLVMQQGVTMQRNLRRHTMPFGNIRSRLLGVGRVPLPVPVPLPSRQPKGVPMQGEQVQPISLEHVAEGKGRVTVGKVGDRNLARQVAGAKGKVPARKRTIVEAGRGDSVGVSLPGDATRPTKRLSPDALYEINRCAGV